MTPCWCETDLIRLQHPPAGRKADGSRKKTYIYLISVLCIAFSQLFSHPPLSYSFSCQISGPWMSFITEVSYCVTVSTILVAANQQPNILFLVSTDPINNPTPYHALDVARAPLALSSAAIMWVHSLHCRNAFRHSSLLTIAMGCYVVLHLGWHWCWWCSRYEDLSHFLMVVYPFYSLAQYWGGHAERQRCITSVVCSFATQLQHLFGYFNVLSVCTTNFCQTLIKVHSVWVWETTDVIFLHCRWHC